MSTYHEASGMPFADVLNRYRALNDRDMTSRSIATLRARGEWNDDWSLNPDDYPPLAVAEHLELIALGEVMARHYRHPAQVHYAVVAGATWEQIAAANGGDAGKARQAYRDWAEGQHRLRQDFPGGTIGLGDGEYAAALEATAGDSLRPGATTTAMSAELAARRTAAAAVLGDYRSGLASAPLTRPPGLEWMSRLADALGVLLEGLDGGAS